ELEQAKAAPLGITDAPGSTSANRFPAYVDLVRRQLARDYPAGALQGAGLSVMTAMSPSAQAYAEGAVAGTLKALDTEKRPPLQAGLVVTDVHDGAVRAVVGSREFARHGFNRAIEARRPVGSVIKPFVYLLALAQPGRWSLASWLDDSPVTVTLDTGKRWTPGNSDGRSHGSVRLMDALAHSYNQATVRLGMEVGPERVADLLRTLSGVDAKANPSLILGALDQSPYAMAQLYQFLASGGEVQPLHAVRGVIDQDGKVVKRYDTTPAPAQEGDAIAARLVTIALQHAVTNGTGRRLVADGLGHLNAAGKTGTSNDSRDSWFAGWTGDHLAVVWVGNDQNEPTGLYGATGAMRVWSSIFARLPSAPLQVSDDGLDWEWVEGSHGTDPDCPGARRFAFVAGFTLPYQPCYRYESDPYYDQGSPADEADEPGFWERLFGGGRGREPDPARRVPPPPPAEPQPPTPRCPPRAAACATDDGTAGPQRRRARRGRGAGGGDPGVRAATVAATLRRCGGRGVRRPRRAARRSRHRHRQDLRLPRAGAALGPEDDRLHRHACAPGPALPPRPAARARRARRRPENRAAQGPRQLPVPLPDRAGARRGRVREPCARGAVRAHRGLVGAHAHGRHGRGRRPGRGLAAAAAG